MQMSVNSGKNESNGATLRTELYDNYLSSFKGDPRKVVQIGTGIGSKWVLK